MTDKRKDGSGKLLYCSFCGKSLTAPRCVRFPC
ncbi:hypothetical protein, partial [Klebsiella pneumoniae]